MSVSEATNMMSLLRFSNKKMRELRTLLRNTNIGNFIPAEEKIRKEQEKRLGHLNENNTDFGATKFKFGTKEENVFKERPYVKIKGLIPFINSEVMKIKNFRSDGEFDGKMWILFSGDKGGTSTNK